MYLWILIAGGINSFLDAGGIGANDLANSFFQRMAQRC